MRSHHCNLVHKESFLFVRDEFFQTTVAAGTFSVGFTSAGGGVFDISMGSTATTSLSEGRYEYNVLVSSGASIYNIVNGNILVYPGISSAP